MSERCNSDNVAIISNQAGSQEIQKVDEAYSLPRMHGHPLHRSGTMVIFSIRSAITRPPDLWPIGGISAIFPPSIPVLRDSDDLSASDKDPSVNFAEYSRTD